MKQFKEILARASFNKNEPVEQTMEPFSMGTLFDFRDSFDDKICALRALAELIGSSNLSLFSNDDGNQNNGYRAGLQMLIELCLKKQEEDFEELFEKALNSPENIIERAKKVFREIEIGSITCPAKSSAVSGAVVDLDTIISLFGSEQYPEAESIKTKIFSKIDGDIYHHVGNGTDG